MAHVVVIGVGIGGVPAAYELRKKTFEKYFLRKVRTGSVTPIYERYVLKLLAIVALKERHQ